MPTLKSIAALAGVSYATVSRAVNGSGYVAPATAAPGSPRSSRRRLPPERQRPDASGAACAAGGADRADARLCPGRWSARGLRAELTAAGRPAGAMPGRGVAGPEPVPRSAAGRPARCAGGHSGARQRPGLAELARTGRAIIAVEVERPAPGMVATTAAGAARAVLTTLGIAPTGAQPSKRPPAVELVAGLRRSALRASAAGPGLTIHARTGHRRSGSLTLAVQSDGGCRCPGQVVWIVTGRCVVLGSVPGGGRFGRRYTLRSGILTSIVRRPSAMSIGMTCRRGGGSRSTPVLRPR